LAQTKVLARLMSGPCSLPGDKGGRPCLLFVRALIPRRLPRQPPHACSGAPGTHRSLPIAKFIKFSKWAAQP
jgi:hypothetical protein